MIESPEKVEATIKQLQVKVASIEGEVINLKRAKIAGQLDIQTLLKQKDELEENIEQLVTKEQDSLQRVKQIETQTTQLEANHASSLVEHEALTEIETELKASINGLEDKENELKQSISTKETSLKKVEIQLSKKRGTLNTLVDTITEVLKVSLIIAAVVVPLGIGAYVLIPANYQEVISQLID